MALKSKVMWKVKKFKSELEAKNWAENNKSKYWIESGVLFLHNGYGISYKPLVKPSSFPL